MICWLFGHKWRASEWKFQYERFSIQGTDYFCERCGKIEHGEIDAPHIWEGVSKESIKSLTYN